MAGVAVDPQPEDQQWRSEDQDAKEEERADAIL